MNQLVYEQRLWSPYRQEGHENGNAFYGTNGMLVLGKYDHKRTLGCADWGIAETLLRSKPTGEDSFAGLGEDHLLDSGRDAETGFRLEFPNDNPH